MTHTRWKAGGNSIMANVTDDDGDVVATLHGEKALERARLIAAAPTQQTALLRIFAAARALERGEESPREVAHDIQRMAMLGLQNLNNTPWPWEEHQGMQDIIAKATTVEAGTAGEEQ